jgi:gamma-glutamyltranspeptidase/glutathione hydrolase
MAFPHAGLAHRPVVVGRHGAVASAHPLASLAGLRMLMAGGNAIDAAVAMAAALNVVEPYMSGAAGVGYMLIYSAKERRLRVLDYVGPAPLAAEPARFDPPQTKDVGPKSALVPGALGGWLAALERYGTMDRAQVFAPAIEYAEEGFPLTINNHRFFAGNEPRLRPYPASVAAYLPGGAVPRPGDVLRQPDLARTFRLIVEGGAEPFYRGDIAREMVRALEELGGLITLEDLAAFRPQWLDPIAVLYRGWEICTVAPPSMGIQYLETLNILEGFDLAAMGHNTAPYIHTVAEAMKLALADRIAYTAQPHPAWRGLLSKSYAAERRRFIGDQPAVGPADRFTRSLLPGEVVPGNPALYLNESTTHFDAIDAEGNVVACTQSLGGGFGSGVVLGRTGLALNNFCYWFDLDPASPNCIGPGKKIEMCLAPCIVLRDGRPAIAIGTPGSYGILQTTPQMLMNLLDHGFSIQAAIEAPRFRTQRGYELVMEGRIPAEVRAELERRGHQVRVMEDWSAFFGGGQGVMIDPDSGALLGGADPRRDGYALAW